MFFRFVCIRFFLFSLVHVLGEVSQKHRRAITNGRVTDPSRAKFFARSGRDKNKKTPDYLCGATLIHNDILVTAAHCQGAFNYGVFLYDENTNDYTREANIDLQIRFPGFNGIEKHNDVLLLRLSSDPGLPIVKINSDDSLPRKSEVLTAYGFGKTTADGPASKKLREGQFTYIDNSECSERIEMTSAPKIWDDVLCADPFFKIGTDIEQGSSICQGDSGGPLLDSSNMLLGIVSWNFACISDHLPDGFARLSAFHDWITEQICFYSRKPLMSGNMCPFGTMPPPPVPSSISVLLTFDHDFYPEETFFRILSKDGFDEKVEYAGPRYVPSRESRWVSQIYLLPVS